MIINKTTRMGLMIIATILQFGLEIKTKHTAKYKTDNDKYRPS